jgi:hypothetical protein
VTLDLGLADVDDERGVLGLHLAGLLGADGGEVGDGSVSAILGDLGPRLLRLLQLGNGLLAAVEAVSDLGVDALLWDGLRLRGSIGASKYIASSPHLNVTTEEGLEKAARLHGSGAGEGGKAMFLEETMFAVFGV